MVHSVLFHLKESFDNPFSLPEKLKNKILMEGIFSTYEPSKVEKYLKKRYGKYAYVERFNNENGIEVFRIGVYNDEENKNVVNKDMALCGYFPSIEDCSYDGSTLYITYEPKK